MRIVLWPLHYLPMIGGAEVQVHRLALGLQQLGHEVIAIANHPLDACIQDSYEGIQVFRFPFVLAFTQCNLRKVKEILHKVSQILAAFAPDVVNTHALVDQINFYQNRIVQTTLCATTHGGSLEADHCRKVECVRLCTKAHVVSAPAQHFLDHLNLKRQVRVIPNGLPPAATPLQPFPKDPVIAMIGRLAPEKGFDTAIHALQYLVPKYPNLKLLLVGDGPESLALSQRIDEFNLHKVVERIGAVPPNQVLSFIDSAQFVCIPSTHECLNLVALETAMRQRAVLGSNIPGLKESVEQGVTGLLTEPRNPQALAVQMDHLLSQPHLAQWMGQNALVKISREFSFEAALQNYLKMYQDAIQTAATGA